MDTTERTARCWRCRVAGCTFSAYSDRRPKCLRHRRRMTETCRTGHQL